MDRRGGAGTRACTRALSRRGLGRGRGATTEMHPRRERRARTHTALHLDSHSASSMRRRVLLCSRWHGRRCASPHRALAPPPPPPPPLSSPPLWPPPWRWPANSRRPHRPCPASLALLQFVLAEACVLVFPGTLERLAMVQCLHAAGSTVQRRRRQAAPLRPTARLLPGFTRRCRPGGRGCGRTWP